MPIKVSCNNCGGVLHAPDDTAGKKGRCPTCQMILIIPADGVTRMGSDQTQGGPVQPSPTYGVANDPPIPRAPTFGDANPAYSRYSSKDLPPAVAVRPPEEPRRPGGPFAKPAKIPEPFDANTATRQWNRVYRNLGVARLGVFCILLGILVPMVLKLLEANGVKLPESAGLLGVDGFPLVREIKYGGAVVFLTLGGLFLLLGRLGIAAVPRSTGAKGLAAFAAGATLLAFAGWLAMIIFMVSAMMNGSPPSFDLPAKVSPAGTDKQRKPNGEERVRAYVGQVNTLSHDDFPGQAQRFGLAALLVAGLVAELWFLGVLSRITANLQSAWATARINRYVVFKGCVLILAAMALLAYNMFDQGWVYANIRQKWVDLGPSMQMSIASGAAIAMALGCAIVYGRMLGGARAAIREAGLR